MKTARTGSEDEARHFTTALATERPTLDSSTAVERAEILALDTFQALAGLTQGRLAIRSTSEWIRAEQAVEAWLRTLERDH